MWFIGWIGGALAHPGEADVLGSRLVEGVFEVEVPAAILTHDLHDELLERASGLAPPGTEVVRVVGVDASGARIPAIRLLPELPPVPDKGDRPLSFPADNPGPTTGALDGRAVYLSQCHGWIWSSTLGRFATQRGNNFSTVEDLHNPEGMNQYLTAYLENAGARVFTVKERDLQTATAIADNDGQGYAETGAGFTTGPAGYRTLAALPYGTDPFDAGTTRRFPADGGAVATWTPNVPVDGFYAVYVSWDSDPANATDAHYRITHPGGVIDRWYDQTVHGSTWQYVEHLWLTAGASLTVELIGDSAQSGAFLSADAVRIGGGQGVVQRNGVTSGRPRWEDGAIQGVQYLGAPASVYDPSNTGNGSDPSSRSRWADWEHPAGEPAVYLSWHSNAATGTARGTVTYYAGGGSDSPHASECSSPAVSGSYSLANAVQQQLIAQIRGRWDASWQDRGLARSCFAEVNPNNNDEMPAILVELAFHDNELDADHLKHPAFRRDAARAMARGIVQYFASQAGVAPVYQPEPPVGLSAVHAPGGGVRLSWQPGPSGGVNGDAPTSYLVYTSPDGRSWDNGFSVSGATTVVNPPYATRFFKVVAVNAGGQSFPSEIVGARHSPDGRAAVLIVGAFDRFDRGLLETANVNTLGNIVRMDLLRMNPGHVIVPHGLAVGDAGWFFDSASDEAVPGLDLSGYDVIVWATGEESTVDETFSDAQQAMLRAYVDAGGALIASGAEILWDLDARGSATDRAFATDVLGALMASDASSSTDVDGVGLLQGLALDFGAGPYPVEFPDVLDTDGVPLATYGNGAEVAGARVGSVATFGFPLDAVEDPSALTELMARLLPELAPDVEPPPIVDPEPPPLPDPDPDPDPDPSEPGFAANARRVPLDELGGCGCAASPGAGGWLALAALALVRRRR